MQITTYWIVNIRTYLEHITVVAPCETSPSHPKYVDTAVDGVLPDFGSTRSDGVRAIGLRAAAFHVVQLHDLESPSNRAALLPPTVRGFLALFLPFARAAALESISSIANEAARRNSLDFYKFIIQSII